MDRNKLMRKVAINSVALGAEFSLALLLVMIAVVSKNILFALIGMSVLIFFFWNLQAAAYDLFKPQDKDDE